MVEGRRIRVLVVDDSLVFREVLARGIASDPNIEVVAKAVDPFDARDKIIEYEPDVMTCDVEMPKMSGIEFIKRLMPQYPLPIIVVSALSEAVFDAMNVGAIDFVTKPDVTSPEGVKGFIEELIVKVKTASTAKVFRNNSSESQVINSTNIDSDKGIIAIGASTGGTEAIYNLLRSLPKNIPGIVIVQHIPPVFSKMFADRLNSSTHFEAKEAETGDLVQSGRVLVAQGGLHIKLKKAGDKYKVQCFSGEKLNGHCPSIDIFFESVAKEGGKQAIGVILTGMGYDGARGLLAMKRKGARTIGQNEKSCVVYGMPKVAYDIGAVEKQTSLENIPNLICSMLTLR